MRRGRLVIVLVAAAVALALVLRGRDEAPARPTSPASMERLLARQLDDKHLSYRYVACIGNGRRFDGQPVIRCNVNFGAPHIEVYCAIVRDGRALTNHEDRSIPCPRDDLGKDPPVQAN